MNPPRARTHAPLGISAAPTPDASQVPPQVHAALKTTGAPVDESVRETVAPSLASALGGDFSQVRVHTDPTASASAQSISAQAYAAGSDIVLANPQDATNTSLMAHELAHVAQNRGQSNAPKAIGAADAPQEHEAQTAASDAMAGRVAHISPAGPGIVARQPAGPTPEEKFETLVSAKLDAAKAREAMTSYRLIATDAARFTAFKAQHAKGHISKLLHALAPDDQVAFRAEMQQMLRWIEEGAARAFGGKTDDQMANAQAKWAKARAEKAAQDEIAKKAPKDKPVPKPTAAEVEAARKKQVGDTSIPPAGVIKWAGMKPAERDAWVKRGEAVIKKVVAHAGKVAPELKLVEADFKADFEAVEKRGLGVLAQGRAGGAKGVTCEFGYEFVEAAEADPAYVMDVVVHEMFGHPEFGAYGSEYDLEIFDKAMSKVPGYVKPAAGTKERTSELDAYAYQETEIYALLRGFAYHKDLDKKDKGKNLMTLDAFDMVRWHIDIHRRQWTLDVDRALMRGLYVRLRADPRITPEALKLFKRAVRANYSGKTAGEILQ